MIARLAHWSGRWPLAVMSCAALAAGVGACSSQQTTVAASEAPGSSSEAAGTQSPSEIGEIAAADENARVARESARASVDRVADTALAARSFEISAQQQLRADSSSELRQVLALPIPGAIERENYETFDSNPIKVAAEEPVSTFSIDVDTASYGVVRRYLQDGTLPPRDAVRIEELINYFDYDYPRPERVEAPFSTQVTLFPTPWNSQTQLLHIGLRGYDVIPAERPKANLVFLVDVSGSMQDENKLPLVKHRCACS
jgi:Ca-activated chloride channel family protein